jgi:hypothetical protein
MMYGAGHFCFMWTRTPIRGTKLRVVASGDVPSMVEKLYFIPTERATVPAHSR